MATAPSKTTSDPARIAVWSTPRAVSTAFARSMSARGDTEVFWEPYFACHNFGPDRETSELGLSEQDMSEFGRSMFSNHLVCRHRLYVVTSTHFHQALILA